MGGAPALAVESGWSARLRLGFRSVSGRTVLAQRQRQGPLSVQRPFYPEGDVCHVYLLHPPGGVVGGDRLQIDTELASRSHALLTTPGATKFYRSAGPLARQRQHLQVDTDACLERLPQENIFFPGAQVDLRTRIDLRGDARLAFWELHCLGRPAIGEDFDQGGLDSRLEVWRDERPLLMERLRVDARGRRYASILNGHPVAATALFSHAREEHLLSARELVAADADSGVTLLDDLLVVRYLGGSTERARKLFAAIWSDLREPLLQRHAIIPRIWNT
jgi:urease accessory protein